MAESGEAPEIARLVARTIAIKDLISSHQDDGQDKEEEKSKKDIDPYVSMKFQGMRERVRHELYRLCSKSICGKYLSGPSIWSVKRCASLVDTQRFYFQRLLKWDLRACLIPIGSHSVATLCI